MKITTIAYYDGTEQYTKKSTNEQRELLRFKNNYGEIEKIVKRDDFDCEVGHKCVITYRKGNSYKTGSRVSYCFPIEVCKIEDFKGTTN